MCHFFCVCNKKWWHFFCARCIFFVCVTKSCTTLTKFRNTHEKCVRIDEMWSKLSTGRHSAFWLQSEPVSTWEPNRVTPRTVCGTSRQRCLISGQILSKCAISCVKTRVDENWRNFVNWTNSRSERDGKTQEKRNKRCVHGTC